MKGIVRTIIHVGLAMLMKMFDSKMFWALLPVPKLCRAGT